MKSEYPHVGNKKKNDIFIILFCFNKEYPNNKYIIKKIIIMNDIIFQDGLERYKIIHNIDNQGQYKWILDVNCKQLIVGLIKDKIHVKAGEWISGLWKDGIYG